MRGAPALRSALAALAAGVALFAATAAPAGALVRPVSADHLARSAQTVVLASAVDMQSYRSADPANVDGLGGAIVTDVRLRVHRVLKGSAAAGLTITVPGGRVNGRGLTCPDAPSFQRRRTYLVYLDDRGQIVAWRRGQPLVVGGRVPDLGKSLQQVERRIALLTGQRATVYSRPPAQAVAAAGAAAGSPARGGAASDSAGPATSASDSPAYLTLPPGAQESSTAGRLPAPVISAITPGGESAGTGAVVTVTGSGFGATQGSGRVWFFYQQADPRGPVTSIEAQVVSWSDTAIACVVPTGIIDGYAASAGTGPVFVSLDSSTYSNVVPFNVTFSYGGQQWPRNRCRYRVNGAGHGDWELAVRQAADTWTALTGGSFRFINGGPAPGTATEPEENGYNDIVWGQVSDPDIIAAAWTYDIGRSILETDIVFNTAFAWGTSGTSTSEMDVQTIAVHELGHWLNLRDLYGPQNAWGPGDTAKIMYGYCDLGVVKRTPDPADAAGVQWIYSPDRRDRQRPTSTVAKAEKVRRSRVVDLTLRVNDPEYSCGAAALRILISDGSGRTVARLLGWGAPTNEWSYVPYTCKLPRGVYRWRVLATDLAGHRQIKIGSNRLVVR